MYTSGIRILIRVRYYNNNHQIRLHNIFKPYQVITAEACNKLTTSLFWLWCKKSGFFTKSVKTFTIKKVNQSRRPENGTQR
jgi:hypothetical protein